MGPSRNFIRGIKSPPPPLRKEALKEKKVSERPSNGKNTPEEKNIAEKHPPSP